MELLGKKRECMSQTRGRPVMTRVADIEGMGSEYYNLLLKNRDSAFAIVPKSEFKQQEFRKIINVWNKTRFYSDRGITFFEGYM